MSRIFQILTSLLQHLSCTVQPRVSPPAPCRDPSRIGQPWGPPTPRFPSTVRRQSGRLTRWCQWTGSAPCGPAVRSRQPPRLYLLKTWPEERKILSRNCGYTTPRLLASSECTTCTHDTHHPNITIEFRSNLSYSSSFVDPATMSRDRYLNISSHDVTSSPSSPGFHRNRVYRSTTYVDKRWRSPES